MVELLNRRPRRTFVLSSAALALALTPALAGPAHAASPVLLGTANSFALLAGSTITNTGPTTINGDIGLCCTGIATTGFGSVTQPAGAQYTGTGGVAATAQDDLDIAYANAAGQAITATLPVDLSLSGTPATPLLPGVYESTSHGSLLITTGLTLDFQGDPNAVFIFQGTDLTTAAAAAGSVNIVNGGSAPSACNIFWQLSSDATGVSLGTASAFKGTTMALGASVLGTNATVEGRILTRRSKAVTLDANTITRSGCSTATAGGGTTTTPGSGGSPTNTPTPGTTATPTPVHTPTRGLFAAPAAVTPIAAAPSGTAKLSGPNAPVRNPFDVWVTGRSIDRVVFSVDGKRIGTVRAKRGRTKFKITVNPRGPRGRVHRLTARITFKPSSQTTSVVRRTTYYTGGDTSRTPRFAG
jgi:type VI secretion system secreted protein VgrG